MTIRLCLILLLAASLPSLAHAHWPEVLGDVPQNAVETVPDPTMSRAYYGTLEGHPHMYEFTLAATTTVFLQTLSPDLERAAGSELVKPTGLLVEMLPSGRVAEITRLYPAASKWPVEYEPFGGDRYLEGPVFEDVLPPGRYRFEVSTPDNVTKYMFVIGTEERWGSTNPFSLLGRIYQVKQFYEKPWYAVWQSPFYYIPSLFLLFGCVVWYSRRRQG